MSTRIAVPASLLSAIIGFALFGSIFGLSRVYGEASHPLNGDSTAALTAPAQHADALSTAFKRAAKTLAPSVVQITAIRRDQVAQLEGFSHPGFGESFDDLFRRFFGDRQPDGRSPRFDRQQHSQPPGFGQGTGFVVREEGYIITNNHVVTNADELTVKLHDGRSYEATVIGTDAESDLAVLKIDSPDLVPVAFGDSTKVEVGEWVIAIGSPFGLEQTVTAGIVSATGRSGMGLAIFENFIQTDAAINPGNSGGPLVNLRAQVVGVNTAISTRNGGYMGVGFAIPSDMARRVADSIIETGRVSRGWLGVQIQTLTEDLARSFGMNDAKGVLIAKVLADGPSAKAGLAPGDVITKIDGRGIAAPAELLKSMAEAAPGSRLQLEVVRDGKTRSFDVTLGERPSRAQMSGAEMQPHSPSSDLGIKVAPLTPQMSRQLGIAAGWGVVVDFVQPGSTADAAGLRTGDVILKIGSTDVAGVDEFWSAISKEDLEAGARFLIQREQARLFLIVKHTRADAHPQ